MSSRVGLSGPTAPSRTSSITRNTKFVSAVRIALHGWLPSTLPSEQRRYTLPRRQRDDDPQLLSRHENLLRRLPCQIVRTPIGNLSANSERKTMLIPQPFYSLDNDAPP